MAAKKPILAILFAMMILTGCEVSDQKITADPSSDVKRLYSSNDPEECKRMLFACVPGRKAFFDDTGCGCELIENEPENAPETSSIAPAPSPEESIVPPPAPDAMEKTPPKTEVMEVKTAPETVAVAIEGFQYSPFNLTIKAGTTVTWTNNDSAPHTITSLGGEKILDSDDLMKDDTFSFTFDTPGTYEYFCAIHPTMKGKVTVSE